MKTWLPPLIAFALVVGLWAALARVFEVPAYLVPMPSAVGGAIVEHLGALVSASLLTGAGALAGFAASLIVGIASACLFSQSKLLERSLYPYAIFLQTVPIVAIAPLIVIWFGTGFLSVVVVVFVVSVFPVITAGTAGLTRIDSGLLDLFALSGASRAQTLWKLRLPGAVPSLVTGAKVAGGLAVVGAIMGEFFAGYGAARQGLGYLIIVTSGQLKTAYLFAAIFAATLLGLAFFTGVSLAGRWILERWHGEAPQ
ncbi:MAG: ABC transporter permease subunit [Chrysiogenetes bacterium]|nr:ABC transporter permease subunit [Chrysiogenetes bacterium]